MVKVSILQAEKPNVKEAIERIGFSFSNQDTIVIKTNLCPSYYGMDGSPMHLDILTQLLDLAEGLFDEIIVVDDQCPDKGFNDFFKKSEAFNICNSYDAAFINLLEDTHIPVKGNFNILKNLKLPKTLLKADMLVNISVMKTSRLTDVSLSLMNLLDFVPKGNSIYKSEIEKAICDILQFRKPDLNIVDGITAIEDNNPKKMNLILASEDPVALDTISCKVMGINPFVVEHIVSAGFMDLGESLINKIEVVGERIEKVRERFVY
jgi:uncharacterized protein (DUF362 family)|tara:strand:+ start:6280 stop:7071 length:792 start_codon:yes stop_codon:yes gene_type:complete